MPFIYVLDKLAQRWHIDPDRLAELSPETIERGLEFMRLESSVRTGSGPRPKGAKGG